MTILGSGTCVPSLKRSSAAAHIKTGNSRILIDIGAGTMRRLLEAGHGVFDITHILITHFHPDHTGELVSFLFSKKYQESSLREKPLTLLAGPGFSEFFKGLTGVYGTWIQLPPEMVRLVELYPNNLGEMDFEDFSLSFAPVSHSPESLSYRILDTAGKAIVYSGDTDVCETLRDLAKDADMLICESAMPEALKVSGHLTPSLAGGIAADARVKKLVLTHFYPECDEVDVAGECRRSFDGPIVLARDLMELEL